MPVKSQLEIEGVNLRAYLSSKNLPIPASIRSYSTIVASNSLNSFFDPYYFTLKQNLAVRPTVDNFYDDLTGNLVSNNDFLQEMLNKNRYQGKNRTAYSVTTVATDPNGYKDSYLVKYSDVFFNRSTKAANIIGSIISGNGVGVEIGNSGANFTSGFDVRNSLLAKTLGSSLIKDTPLGIIGAKQLKQAVANNAAANIIQSTIGQFDFDYINMIKEGRIKTPNYRVTKPKDGKFIDYVSRVLGYYTPKSEIGEEVKFYNGYKPHDYNSVNVPIPTSSEVTNNALLQYTGEATVDLLFRNLNENIYKPNLKVENKEVQGNGYTKDYTDNGIVADEAANQQLRAKEFGELPKFGARTQTSGVVPQPGLSDNQFTWVNPIASDGSAATEKPVFPTNKGLLYKTQLMFQTGKIKNMITETSQLADIDQTQTAVKEISKGPSISRGNAVRNKDNSDFCRVWTVSNQYIRLNDAIRHEGLRGPFIDKNYASQSVLDPNGLVRIAPYSKSGTVQEREPFNAKRYMFSIENLAWNEDKINLPSAEQGQGDLLSGISGRIMWFPPYDLKLSETNQSNWESEQLLGRPEPIFTWKNAERKMSLSFKIITDHSSILNCLCGKDKNGEDLLDKYFAGCLTDDDIACGFNNLTIEQFAQAEKVKEENKVADTPVVINTATDSETSSSSSVSDVLRMYFPNASTNYEQFYEDGVPNPGAKYYTDITAQQNTQFYVDGNQGSLNVEFNKFINKQSSSKIQEILLDKDKAKKYKYTITGSFSTPNGGKTNDYLGRGRADTMQDQLLTAYPDTFGLAKRENRVSLKTNEDKRLSTEKEDINLDSSKQDRFAMLTLEYIPSADKEKTPVKPTIDQAVDNPLPEGTNSNVPPKVLREDVAIRCVNELNYFQYLETSEPLAFKSIAEKIKYFNPAFHSMTPEGLNSRLTFLLQCTRQGRSIGDDLDKRPNMAFGRPPVCILRIGDFYHTKVIIHSVNIDYEPLMWDLNPEGIGVQPMIANVNLDMSIIGGSSISNPINRLQNALSFNYFANTEFYDFRSDRITIDTSGSAGDAKAKIVDRNSKQKMALQQTYGNSQGALDPNKNPKVVIQPNQSAIADGTQN